VNVASSERSGPSRVARLAKWVLELLVWTLLTWGIWLLTLTALDKEDLFVGGLSAIGCGAAATAARRIYAGSWEPHHSSLGPALLLPVAIVTDALSVLAAPWCLSRDAEVVEIGIGAAGTTARAKARRAIATLVVTATPGSVVLDVAPDDGRLVVHRLHTRGPDLAARYSDR